MQLRPCNLSYSCHKSTRGGVKRTGKSNSMGIEEIFIHRAVTKQKIMNLVVQSMKTHREAVLSICYSN
jgi:hypothetical protein